MLAQPGIADSVLDGSAARAVVPVPATLVTKSRLLGEALPSLLAPFLNLRLLAVVRDTQLPEGATANPTGHVVIIDAGIGLDAMVRLTRYWRGVDPRPHVIVIEVPEVTDTILTCIEAGIGGYTVQGASPADVAEAIRWVGQGLAHCTPQVAAELFARFAASATVPVPLTGREIDVLRCINQDLSNQEIAAALVIEIRTVKHHVHSILHKLKLNHRWEAARVASERGWLS